MTALTHELIAESAARGPDSPALCHDGAYTSYHELNALVAAASCGLTGLGIKKSDRIAIYLEKRLETVVALFAGFRCGAIAVPVNPSLKMRQVVHILRDSGARLLVTSQVRATLIQECFEQHGLELRLIELHILGGYGCPFRHYHRSFHAVLELASVSRPGVSFDSVDRTPGESSTLESFSLAEFAQECPRKQQGVPLSIA